MNTLRIWMIFQAMVVMALSGVASPAFAALQALDDQALSQETGQAAFYTAYNAPSGAGTGATPSDYGFFTLGLNGTVQINTNVQHLQLGCGGVNGPGCDIDFNNFSLTGNPDGGTGPGHYAVGTNPASTDAVLTNPFIRLAIANPTSLSTRSLVGFQLGAAQAVGLLQAGQNTNYPNGINSLSGYMQVQSYACTTTPCNPTLTGSVNTAPSYFPVYQNSFPGGASNPANYKISGTMTALGGFAATVKFYLSGGGFYIPGFNGASFAVPAPVVNGSRLPGITVTPSVTLPNVIVGYNPDDANCGTFANSNCNMYGTPTYNPNFSAAGSNASYPIGPGVTVGTQGGPVSATTTSCSGIGCIFLSGGGVGVTYNVHMYGQVNNISANVSFLQPLGYIHSIPVNSPMALSLQSTPVLWPGSPTVDVAQPGWWLGVNDPVVLGPLTPSSAVSLCPVPANANMCVYPQFAAQFNTFLKTTVLNSNALGPLLSGNGAIGAPFGKLTLTPINLALNGVQLSTQNTIPNCYGTLKFCFFLPMLWRRRMFKKKADREEV